MFRGVLQQRIVTQGGALMPILFVCLSHKSQVKIRVCLFMFMSPEAIAADDGTSELCVPAHYRAGAHTEIYHPPFRCSRGLKRHQVEIETKH